MTQTDLYLSYLKTVVNNGENFYYLQSAFLPDDALSALIVYLIECELDIDVFPYFSSMPDRFPSEIAQNTNCYELDGTTWVAPEDLYLVVVLDSPAAGTISPELSDIFARTTIAIYAEVPASPDMVEDLPTEISPDTYPPNVEENPFFYHPENWGLMTSEVYFNNSGSTAWLHWFGIVYGGCEPFDPGHAYVNTDDFTFTEIDSGGEPKYESTTRWYWDSCHDEEQVGAYWVESRLGQMVVDYYAPLASEPALWFTPDLFDTEEEPPQLGPVPFAFLLPLLGLLFPDTLSKLFPIFSFEKARFDVSAPREFLIIVNDSDHMVVNESDRVIVGF